MTIGAGSVLLIGIGYELFDIVTWILFVDLAKRRGCLADAIGVFW